MSRPQIITTQKRKETETDIHAEEARIAVESNKHVNTRAVCQQGRHDIDQELPNSDEKSNHESTPEANAIHSESINRQTPKPLQSIHQNVRHSNQERLGYYVYERATVRQARVDQDEIDRKQNQPLLDEEDANIGANGNDQCSLRRNSDDQRRQLLVNEMQLQRPGVCGLYQYIPRPARQLIADEENKEAVQDQVKDNESTPFSATHDKEHHVEEEEVVIGSLGVDREMVEASEDNNGDHDHDEDAGSLGLGSPLSPPSDWSLR